MSSDPIQHSAQNNEISQPNGLDSAQLLNTCPVGLLVLHAPTNDPETLRFVASNSQADIQSGFAWSAVEPGTLLKDARPGIFGPHADGSPSMGALAIDALRLNEPIERAHARYDDGTAPAATFWIRFIPQPDRQVIISFRNLTDPNATHPAEALALNRLEAVNEDLRHFATAVAHDLKNPIATIIGFAELAKRDDTLGAQAQKLLNLIGMSARRATAMIDDLLDYSRHAGQTGERVRTSLDQELDWAIETLRPRLLEVDAAIVRPAPCRSSQRTRAPSARSC